MPSELPRARNATCVKATMTATSLAESSNSRTTFIAATPLQIFVALAIMKQLGLPSLPELKIVAHFHNALSVSNALRNSLRLVCDVSYYQDYTKAILSAGNSRYRNIFIHWDLGFRTHLLLRKLRKMNPAACISVFEEGVGTYRTDIYNGYRRVLLPLLGLPTRIGEHRNTDAIYVYNPSQYRATHPFQSNVITINRSVAETITEYQDAIWAAFDETNYLATFIPTHTRCILYLSGWVLDSTFIAEIDREGSDFLIKPHPSLKTVAGTLPLDAAICPRGLPAELVIRTLSNKYTRLLVIHHGSSVTEYVSAQNVKFLKLPTFSGLNCSQNKTMLTLRFDHRRPRNEA